jgi:hypothetical protein
MAPGASVHNGGSALVTLSGMAAEVMARKPLPGTRQLPAADSNGDSNSSNHRQAAATGDSA